MEAFKGSRLFNSGKVTDLRPTAASVHALKALSFFKDELIEALTLELPSHPSSSGWHSKGREWWDHNKAALPKWNLGFSRVILVQPSSASAERVFSILKRHYTQYQNTSLQDHVKVGVMLEFNYS